MGKRKVFAKTDISVPQVEYNVDTAGNVVILRCNRLVGKG